MTDADSEDKKPRRPSGRAAMEGYLFEQLIADLLRKMAFSDVQLEPGGPDMGIDILANFLTNTPTGDTKPVRYAVQVKHRPEGRLSSKDIAHLAAMSQLKHADKVLLVTSANLTSSAKDYAAKFADQLGGNFEIWDRDQLATQLAKFADLQQTYKQLVEQFPLSVSAAHSPAHTELIARLESCPPGRDGWREYEDICAEILTICFCPPLKAPKIQPRTMTGLERRDAVFSLRGDAGSWQSLRDEFEANFLLCEFKNYTDGFGKDEVNQTRNYLKKTVGRIAIIFSRIAPSESALKMRNSVFAEENKVILFFDDKRLVELLKLRGAQQDPLDLVQDAIEDFYLSYE